MSSLVNDSDSGLPALNRRMDANTAAVVELESTIKGYADAYKTKLEDNAGIIPPHRKQLEQRCS